MAHRTGDTRYLLDRAYSGVIELYGGEMCADYFTNEFSPDPTYALGALSYRGPEHMDLAIDGRMVAVDDAYAVDVAYTEGGEQGQRVMYVAEEGGAITWFPDCGRPLLSDRRAEQYLLVRVEGTGISETFGAPDSWRIEARAGSGSCAVSLHDVTAGTSETLKSSDQSFVVQLGGRGQYRIESIGCERVSVYENTAET